ncbi:nicotinamide-nucleotide amidase [Tistlia consotensis]|uniref:Nicotinamide-nucleotide amidase n=1 Tax=Tistlia consotensis USBA 355 TaxID=560819 RepID=A0A1Y6C984_9PROT|nr:CinA family protein [Tistlia consotensis]SMF48718.1 nicotinamide-nucleotide amidase [Tistlia consotensis USBA 355]SNR80844.1 nicotinamide-nucleotide amidase [Tistlia consotensis]
MTAAGSAAAADLPEPIFPPALTDLAGRVLAVAGAAGLRLASAETVTAGLVSACLTSVSGASSIFERGFVLYHGSAKASGLGVSAAISEAHGAVSAEVTRALAEGALSHSTAGAVVAVTGYAGPGGGNERDPVGTIYLAAVRRGRPPLERRCVFAGSRDAVRLQAVQAAMALLLERLES